MVFPKSGRISEKTGMGSEGAHGARKRARRSHSLMLPGFFLFFFFCFFVFFSIYFFLFLSIYHNYLGRVMYTPAHDFFFRCRHRCSNPTRAPFHISCCVAAVSNFPFPSLSPLWFPCFSASLGLGHGDPLFLRHITYQEYPNTEESPRGGPRGEPSRIRGQYQRRLAYLLTEKKIVRAPRAQLATGGGGLWIRNEKQEKRMYNHNWNVNTQLELEGPCEISVETGQDKAKTERVCVRGREPRTSLWLRETFQRPLRHPEISVNVNTNTYILNFI
ncbi:hypothetical protein FIM1_1647 [Kluyveromyces marxianus]|uniref:Uncharacterized protein n=1 Tax=Kluyveromyces marxianus TaxID=4911 RepID=A0ABX6EVQ7_KLUMA|nr:hypothetical protein FIM1_1647 [Kluyveromyces marxianus]